MAAASTWTEWFNALLRWIHVIAGIMWIGDSLLFMWIDSRLRRDPQGRGEVEGVTWLLHGGGYYQLEKRSLIPGKLPPYLRWFWLEATTTWISGFLLLIVVYYLSAASTMVEPGVSPITPRQAVAAGLALLVTGWFAYDALWRSSLKDRPAAGAALSFALLVAAGYAATRVFSARAAFLHIGALLGTIMAANVWVHIMLPQREMMRQARAGRAVDARLGAHAKTRSTHNTYLTFPAIFLMFSNHFPGIYAGPLNWVVLALLIAFGAGVRHIMLVGFPAARGAALGSAAAAAGLLFLTIPRAPASPPAASSGAAPAFVEVREIVVRRCTACHSETPTDRDFRVPAGGVRFDSPAQIRAWAARIKVRAVEQKTMPFANATGMTEEERAILGRWVDAGAPLR